MNEDYLWDKSGEPDSEIVQLEKRLEGLRYKRPAVPLPLPAKSRWSNYLSFSPALAAAAALLLLLLAGGLWLGLRSSSSTDERSMAEANPVNEVKQSERVVSGPRPPIGPEPVTNNKQQADELTAKVSSGAVVTHSKSPRRYSVVRQMTAGRARNANVQANPEREQIAREGENAKAQLILALHIASDKLNAVQKKIQANPGT